MGGGGFKKKLKGGGGGGGGGGGAVQRNAPMRALEPTGRERRVSAARHG